MTSEGGALEHVEETSKLYRDTTVELKQPAAGGYLRVSKLNIQKFIILLVFDMGLGSGEKVELYNYIIRRLSRYVRRKDLRSNRRTSFFHVESFFFH